MPVELLNPDGLPKPEVYRQVAVASGSRTVFLAGQVARTAQGEPIGGGDLAAQVEQACLNVATALAAVGGTFDDVAKLTLYVVDWTGDKMAALVAGVERAAARLELDLTKPVTLIRRRSARRARPACRGGRRRPPPVALATGTPRQPTPYYAAAGPR